MPKNGLNLSPSGAESLNPPLFVFVNECVFFRSGYSLPIACRDTKPVTPRKNQHCLYHHFNKHRIEKL